MKSMLFFSLFEPTIEVGTIQRRLCFCKVFLSVRFRKLVFLSGPESKKYQSVKEAVLKAYELVAEAYRQRIRNWCKGESRFMLRL